MEPMARVKHTDRTAHLSAATNLRSFRSFLLMAQFEAREIGARIALARNEKGLTQDELASMASFSKRSLQDYETGETIPYRHFAELGRLLGKPHEWFLYGEKEPEPTTAEEFRSLQAELAEVHGRLARVDATMGQVLAALERLAPPEEQPPAAAEAP